MSKLSEKDIAIIAKLRAVGYSQGEIADMLGVTQNTIAYHIHRLRERAEKEGADAVFAKVLLSLYGISLEKVLEYIFSENVERKVGMSMRSEAKANDEVGDKNE